LILPGGDLHLYAKPERATKLAVPQFSKQHLENSQTVKLRSANSILKTRKQQNRSANSSLKNRKQQNRSANSSFKIRKQQNSD
jgi:hypothetical protein